LRRQLGLLGVELKLGARLRALPAAAPATRASIAVSTEAGEELEADIWYRCLGGTVATGYLRRYLADARDNDGYLYVDRHLQVIGQDRVFAVGDMTAGYRNMAAVARAQAQVAAANIRALIAGERERVAYEPQPPGIAVPLGPDGGAGQMPGQAGIVGAQTIAELKGRALRLDYWGALFDKVTAAAHA
jgi:NADH dehydrogenase FAD-containing subunit